MSNARATYLDLLESIDRQEIDVAVAVLVAADALYNVAESIHKLGANHAGPTGAVEALSFSVKEAGAEIAAALTQR